MNKFLSRLLGLMLVVSFAFPVFAVEEAKHDVIKVDAVPDENLEEDVNLFIEAPAEPGRAAGLTAITDSDSFISDSSNLNIPECDNPRLHDLVIAKINAYFNDEKSWSIIERRRQVLMLRNLQSYITLDPENFSLKENSKVADKLITYKINKGLTEDKIRLCRSGAERQIYLFIYPEDAHYRVEIINFPGQINSEKFSVVYD